MNQVIKLKVLANLSYFNKSSLLQLMDIQENSLYANIKRWIKNGQIIQLKKGLYVTGEYFEKHARLDAYSEFIANKLYEPSYISREYVLQQHGILAEAVYALTSVTLKTKRSYANKAGRFIYRNMKDELFNGFEILDKDGFQIKIATKAKALFDYLYLKFLRVKFIDEKLLELLRLDLDVFTKNDFSEFSGYCAKTKIRKFYELPNLLRKIL